MTVVRSRGAGANSADSGGTPWRAVARGLRSFWANGRPVERWCYRISAFLIVVGLFHLGVFAVAGGPWQGPVSWRKPTTFGLSFGLTLLTLTWVASFLALGERARRILLGLFAAACVLEVALITLQAWRRVPSHFDLATPFDAIVARSLAIGGGALIAIVVAFAVVAFRANPGTPPSMRLAIRAGFIALLLALAAGAVMIAEGMLRVFASDQQGAYTIAVSLKPAHFVAMHGILILPVLAWLLSLADWDESRRVRLVCIAVAGYALLVGVVSAVSLARIALTDAPVIAVFLAMLGAVVLCGAGMVAVVGLMRPAAKSELKER